MAKITLDSIREAAEAKYGTYTIELDDNGNVVELLHPIRLSETARRELVAVQESSREGGEGEEEGADADAQVDRFLSTLRIVTATPHQFELLQLALSPRGYPDLGLIAEVVAGWMKDQKVGEASPSQG